MESVKDELFNATTYKFLTEVINKLEESATKKEQQRNVYKEAGSKNPNVQKFAEDKNPEVRLKTMYAPLVAVDVERSFSKYKLVLTDRRQNLTLDNIEMLNVIYFNSFMRKTCKCMLFCIHFLVITHKCFLFFTCF